MGSQIYYRKVSIVATDSLQFSAQMPQNALILTAASFSLAEHSSVFTGCTRLCPRSRHLCVHGALTCTSVFANKWVEMNEWINSLNCLNSRNCLKQIKQFKLFQLFEQFKQFKLFKMFEQFKQFKQFKQLKQFKLFKQFKQFKQFENISELSESIDV